VIGQGLLGHHTHFLMGDLGNEITARAIQWIVFEHTVAERPDHMTLYINSEGGDLYNAFALVDMMKLSQIPIYTVGIGKIMSAAVYILACGATGHRYIAPHTGIMMHEFYTDMGGKEHEIKASMIEMAYCRDRVNELLVTHCGITEKKIKEKLLQSSDVWLTAKEAIKFKLADSVLNVIL
jgi:ATP-dependent Clp protease protease subunit